jgi:hypothetical protein
MGRIRAPRFSGLFKRRPTSASGVRIRTSPGRIDVEARCLFTADDAVHSLITRLFRLEFVQAIKVQRGRRTVVIEFDRHAVTSHAALSRCSCLATRQRRANSPRIS